MATTPLLVSFDQAVEAQDSAPAAESWEFGPGDSFVVPSGFAGTWEVIQDCRKLYAIHETAA